MADDTKKPWEQYGGAEVLESAPKEPGKAVPAEGKPWEQYGNHAVITEDDAYEGHLADAAAQAVTAAAEAQAADMSGGEKVLDWLGDVGRGTLFGPISDPISALILSRKFKDQGVTYEDALEVVKANNEATKSTTASITGAILGGGMVAGGLKRSADWATTRSGLAKGAMQWAAKDKRLNRIVGAAGAGMAAGMVEEGIRTGLEEAVDVSGGGAFDKDRVVDNVLFGALIGGAATPALQESLRGGKWFVDIFRRMAGSDEASAAGAASRLLKEYKQPNESMDAAADRFRQSVMEFQHKNGRLPAAAEIMAPEQVRNISEVVRMHNGLDTRARELGEEGVERALREYDEVVTAGNAIPSTELIEDNMEDLFTDVMQRHGNKMVNVDEETMVYLQRNRDWIRQIGANGNAGAVRMSRILDAQSEVGTMRKRFQDLLDKKNSSDARAEVMDLKEDLARLLDEAFHEGGADASDIAELRNLIQLKDAIEKSASAGRNATSAGFDLEEFRPMLTRTIRELDQYSQNGLKISLSDANNIRATAARHFNALRFGDPDKADAARRVRDAVAPIGRAEVPEYGNVVKRYNLEMNRSEAQATGIAAARGDINLQDLMVRLEKGRLPGKPKQTGPDQIFAIKEGAAEGTRRELSEQIMAGTARGVASAKRLASSPNARKTVAATLGDMDGKEIARHAQKVSDTYEQMKALAAPRSRSTLAEEMEKATEIATGGVFTNLGGAGRAAFIARVLRGFKIPRGTATKLVDMLGEPGEAQRALQYMQDRGIRIGPLFAAIQQSLITPVENQ